MKKQIYLQLIVIVSLLMSSCASYVSMQTMQAAQITIPSHIKKIGLVNRSVPDKQNQNQIINVIEGILTGESIGADRMGGEQSLFGVKEALLQTNRFEVSVPAVNINGVASPMLNGPLDYSVIHEICQRHNLDALVVLEYFDSDAKIMVNKRVQEQLQKGVKVMVTDFLANADLRVRTTWRVYDDSTKNIIDEHNFEDISQFSNAGPTPELAQGGLPNKRNAINQSGFHAGRMYGNRIAPFWVTVQRRFYRKGTHDMELANARALKNRWEEAIVIWKKECNNIDKKIAGKAHYNLAVACEREGNLELALEYAKTAKTKYQNKWAGSYINVLQRRMANRQKLELQFGTNN